jgi:hypothetical protein
MNPTLNWKRIESWLRQFAEVLEQPELWEEIARLKPQGCKVVCSMTT